MSGLIICQNKLTRQGTKERLRVMYLIIDFKSFKVE